MGSHREEVSVPASLPVSVSVSAAELVDFLSARVCVHILMLLLTERYAAFVRLFAHVYVLAFVRACVSV
jgi:hypothetical protein